MNTINALNSAPAKCPAQVIELPVSLEELYNGGLRKYTVSRKVTAHLHRARIIETQGQTQKGPQFKRSNY